nr:uncharacterized protein LOC128685045 [Cherax quadricarinatus]
MATKQVPKGEEQKKVPVTAPVLKTEKELITVDKDHKKDDKAASKGGNVQKDPKKTGKDVKKADSNQRSDPNFRRKHSMCAPLVARQTSTRCSAAYLELSCKLLQLSKFSAPPGLQVAVVRKLCSSRTPKERSQKQFFHITKDDEETYRATGEIAPQVVDQAVRKALVLDVALTGTRPTCKEFLKGICNMQNCRFRHLSQREYEDEVFHALQDELEMVLGPPERRQSPPSRTVFSSLSSYLDPPKYSTPPVGDYRDDLLMSDDLRTTLLSRSDYEPGAKRPRYFDEPLFSARDDYGDNPRRWDDRMDYDRDRLDRGILDRDRLDRDRLDLNLTETERMMQELYNLRNDNLDLRRNLEQKIGDLREELNTVMQENVGLRHENTKLRAAANEDALTHKAAIEKLTLANSNLSQESRKTQEAVRRLEHENNEIRKALDVKQKTNNAQLEKKLDALEKENIQVRDSLNKVNATLKKTQEDKGKLETELEELKIKSRNQPATARKDGHQNSNPGYNQRNDYSRDSVAKGRPQTGPTDTFHDDRREQDVRGSGNARGSDRYGSDKWVSETKVQYNQGYSTRGSDTRGADAQGPNVWSDADRSRNWPAGGPAQTWGTSLKNQTPSAPLSDSGPSRSQGLLGEYKPVDDRMRSQTSSLQRGTAYPPTLVPPPLSNMPDYSDQSLSQGPSRGFKDPLATGGQYSAQGTSQYSTQNTPQYSTQNTSRFEGRDYGLSGYDSENRNQYGSASRPLSTSSHWQVGGGADNGETGRGMGQTWNRRGKPMSNY